MSAPESEPQPGADAIAVRQMRAFLAGAALLLLAGSWLLWSSPEYRELHLLVFSLLALTAFGAVAWPALRHSGGRGVLLGVGVLLAQASAWIGGVANGAAPVAASLAAAKGLVGVAGVAVLAAVWLDPRWRGWLKATGLGMLGMVLVASLAGYAMIFENFIPLGGDARWFDQMRLAAGWPTRLLTACHGQIVWENSNYAGYYFGLALALVLESLGAGAGAGRRRWWRWLLVGALATALFLTASRTGAVMVALALPVVLAGRAPRFALQAVLVTGVGAVCGYLMLTSKVRTLEREADATAAAEATARAAATTAAKPPSKPSAQPVPKAAVPVPERIPTKEAHTTKYFERASAGRTKGYKALWDEGQDSRWCGLGLAAAGRDILFLNHEHSSYMATLRCGGLIGVAGHVMVLLSAAWSAWLLLRCGTRWPAVLVLAGLGGLLFDRSTVWALTGNYEFPAHWLAVWVPVLLASMPSPRSTSTISPLGG